MSVSACTIYAGERLVPINNFLYFYKDNVLARIDPQEGTQQVVLQLDEQVLAQQICETQKLFICLTVSDSVRVFSL